MGIAQLRGCVKFWGCDVTENEVARELVDAALRVHRELGPGMLESVYEAALAHELSLRGRDVRRQVAVSIKYRGVTLDEAFRADLIVDALVIVDDLVIVELKSVEAVSPVHKKQLLTYLRLADKRLGLLLNFGCELMKQGITRIANNLNEDD